MRLRKFGLVTLLAATGATVVMAAAPSAVADECDPTATVCQNVPGGNAINASPPASSVSADQYPYDNDWYYGAPSEGQLTETNPGVASPSYGGGGGIGGGGIGGGGGGHGR